MVKQVYAGKLYSHILIIPMLYGGLWPSSSLFRVEIVICSILFFNILGELLFSYQGLVLIVINSILDCWR